MSLLLSVVIFNYNHAPFLKGRISSVLDQLPDNSEVILLDDASTDESVRLARAFEKQDPRFRVQVNSKNLGVEQNIDQGPNVARGTYYFPLAADDTLLPGAIEKLLNPLLQNPHMGLSTSVFASIDTETQDTWIQLLPPKIKERKRVRTLWPF